MAVSPPRALGWPRAELFILDRTDRSGSPEFALSSQTAEDCREWSALSAPEWKTGELGLWSLKLEKDCRRVNREELMGASVGAGQRVNYRRSWKTAEEKYPYTRQTATGA